MCYILLACQTTPELSSTYVVLISAGLTNLSNVICFSSASGHLLSVFPSVVYMLQWQIQIDISFGWARRSSAEGAKIEESKAWVGGVHCGEGKIFFNLLLKNGVFLSILMSKCASHVYTCIAYFHFHQYKPTSYKYARVKTSC